MLSRLQQLGYGPELNYFGRDHFRESGRKTHKPLTDKGQCSRNKMALYSKLIVDTIEWARMLPEWLETMNHYRQKRLVAVVYPSRRLSLESEYDIYVRHRLIDTPIFGLLPHVVDLARFPRFRDIIKAPEESPMGEKPFASAFAQLPALVEEWRKQLDAELAELVRIPRLSSQGTSSRRVVASKRTESAESRGTDLDKLHLACAVFSTADGSLFMHPEVFLASALNQYHPGPKLDDDVPTSAGPILDRFIIRFLEEAPYIVHACGLDPGVATMDDMDRRNARLRCLACDERDTIVMNWRNAVCPFFTQSDSLV